MSGYVCTRPCKDCKTRFTAHSHNCLRCDSCRKALDARREAERWQKEKARRERNRKDREKYHDEKQRVEDLVSAETARRRSLVSLLFRGGYLEGM